MSGIDEPSTSSGRPARNMPKIDYKKFSEGNFAEVAFSDTQSDENAASQYEDADDVLPLSDPDEEIERMQREMASLEEESKMLQKSQAVREMRLKLTEKRKEVQKLRGIQLATPVEQFKHKPKRKTKCKQKHSSQVNICNDNSESSEIDIGNLRKDENLKRLVKKELANLGLSPGKDSTTSSESTSTSSSDHSSDTNDNTDRKSKKKKKTHKKKSGISAKASDRVKFPQKWPHAHLQREYVSKHVKFEELDFKLFIAGELEIISEEGLPKAERIGRLNLLKKIVYYCSTYDFKGLREFYAAWLREIEQGHKSWLDSTFELESAILNKHIRSQKTSKTWPKKDFHVNKPANTDEEKVWFCSLYQKNKCLNRANHMVVVKGKMRMALHICATCWLQDKKKLEHPESSTACPHQTA